MKLLFEHHENEVLTNTLCKRVQQLGLCMHRNSCLEAHVYHNDVLAGCNTHKRLQGLGSMFNAVQLTPMHELKDHEKVHR